jgi:structural maintenance of chromosome 2
MQFDMELHDLDEVIKVKKQVAANVDVSIKKVKHEVQALAKEKVSHLIGATNLEKYYNWIVEES